MITPANDGTDDVAGGITQAHAPNGGAASTQLPGTAQLPNSLVYTRLIQRFQRPMKAPDESAAMLTVRPMCGDTKVVDRIESHLDQQLSSLEVIDACVKDCRSTVKPRLKETVQVCLFGDVSVPEPVYC